MNDTNNFSQFQEPNLDQTTNAEKDSVSIPVIEEKLKIEKEIVVTGKVRITKKVDEHEELINIPLAQEEIVVEHIPLNKYIDTQPEPVRYEGETMIIPVIKEVLIVEKRILLVEEIRITKRINQTNESQQIMLRKEEINIEHSTINNKNIS
jgi:uncharacterized protein (TIGR02271 family)